MSTIQTRDDGPAQGLPHGVDIRLLTRADEMVGVVDVFRQIWGSPTDLVRIEMLMAIAHAGGYVSVALETADDGSERVLGASVGILARHQGRPALHSHVTGLLPGARRMGVGRAIKLHQQAWAREQGIEWIVWTFDPLVRRNAWFNIAVLGAEVHEYRESFYGTMTDAINAGDESDRLVVVWSVDADPDAAPHDGSDIEGAELVPTPDDVIALRRTDPDAVAAWRRRTRERLRTALAEGRHVHGFTRAGEYVLEPPR